MLVWFATFEFSFVFSWTTYVVISWSNIYSLLLMWHLFQTNEMWMSIRSRRNSNISAFFLTRSNLCIFENRVLSWDVLLKSTLNDIRSQFLLSNVDERIMTTLIEYFVVIHFIRIVASNHMKKRRKQTYFRNEINDQNELW